MARLELFALVLGALCFALGTWCLAGQPGATPCIVVSFIALATRAARYRHLQQR